MEQIVKIETLPLFPVLNKMLVELLQSLSAEEWQAQTVARIWKVKDVAAHILDGYLKGLSISRDGYFGVPPGNIDSYQDLVGFINQLNHTWTDAAKRLSPAVLIALLSLTGKPYTDHLETLDPFADAVFPVAWAGQEKSPNWFHIAREYTEQFLHQQQIRDAVNKPGILTRELFYPFLDTLVYALPSTFKNIQAATGTVVTLIVTTEIGGQWNIVKTGNGWELTKDLNRTADAAVSLHPDTAWKLFSKSRTAAQVAGDVTITGDPVLAYQVLNMVAVMA